MENGLTAYDFFFVFQFATAKRLWSFQLENKNKKAIYVCMHGLHGYDDGLKADVVKCRNWSSSRCIVHCGFSLQD